MSELLAGAVMGLGEGIIQAARIQKQEALAKRKELEQQYVLEARLNDPESTKAQKRSARHKLEAMQRAAATTGMDTGRGTKTRRSSAPTGQAGTPTTAGGGGASRTGLGRKPQKSVRDEWLDQNGPPRKTRNQIRRERSKQGLGRKPGAAEMTESEVKQQAMQQAEGAPKGPRRRSSQRSDTEDQTKGASGQQPDPNDPGIFERIDAAIREVLPYKLEVGTAGIRVTPLDDDEEKPAKKGEKAAPSGGVAKPKNAAEYESLPPGTRYLHPDGTVKTKK